jgi:hypothetical protein
MQQLTGILYLLRRSFHRLRRRLSSGWNPVLIVVISLCFVAGACGSSYSSNEDPPESAPAEQSAETRSDNGLEFHGYDCTVDCSGHQAGYDWAEQQGIDDEDDCGGNSESFIEGCKAFVQENAESNAGSQDDPQDEPDDDGGNS